MKAAIFKTPGIVAGVTILFLRGCAKRRKVGADSSPPIFAVIYHPKPAADYQLKTGHFEEAKVRRMHSSALKRKEGHGESTRNGGAAHNSRSGAAVMVASADRSVVQGVGVALRLRDVEGRTVDGHSAFSCRRRCACDVRACDKAAFDGGCRPAMTGRSNRRELKTCRQMSGKSKSVQTPMAITNQTTAELAVDESADCADPSA